MTVTLGPTVGSAGSRLRPAADVVSRHERRPQTSPMSSRFFMFVVSCRPVSWFSRLFGTADRTHQHVDMGCCSHCLVAGRHKVLCPCVFRQIAVKVRCSPARQTSAASPIRRPGFCRLVSPNVAVLSAPVAKVSSADDRVGWEFRPDDSALSGHRDPPGRPTAMVTASPDRPARWHPLGSRRVWSASLETWNIIRLRKQNRQHLQSPRS